MESDFQKTGEFGPISKLERVVDTPQVKKSDARYTTSYESEENRVVVYETEQYYVQVSKISNRGWSVRRYDEQGFDKRAGYFDEESEAHTVAREMIEEVLTDE